MSKDTLTSLMDNLIQNLASGKLSSKDFLEEVKLSVIPLILDTIMKEERDIYLNENMGEYANGFYTRGLYLNNTPLKVNIPRTRSSNFYPSSIPKYSRYLPEEYSNMLEGLFLSARSIEGLKASLKRLNLPISSEEINNIIDTLSDEFQEFITRELSPDWLVVFIDAKELDVKEDNKVKKMVLLTGVGINMEGKKEVIGSKLFDGNENLTVWREFLLDLKDRGLLRVLLFVTDNFPGITKLIKGLFPLSIHQLCLVHLIRNAKLHLSKDEYKYFKEMIGNIEKARTFENAYTLFMEIIEKIKPKHPHFSKELKLKTEHFVTFTRFPEELRTRLKSTNASENLHKELEKIRLNTGGYFQSKTILYAKWYIFLKRLHTNRWAKPEPKFKGALGELHSIFYKTFEMDETTFKEKKYALTQNS